jgi:hypothetical protein
MGVERLHRMVALFKHMLPAGACSTRNHEARPWGHAIELTDPGRDLPVDGAGHEEDVGVADAADEENAEALHIVTRREAVQNLYVAVIA